MKVEYCKRTPYHISAATLFMTVSILVCSASFIQAEEPQAALVKIQQAASDIIWQGQKGSFSIELLSRTWFSGTPRFEIPHTADGLIIKVQDRPVQGTTIVNGASYTTQLHEFWFFPRKPGEFTVPQITVHFATAGKPGKKGLEHTLLTTPFRQKVIGVEGFDSFGEIISTTKFASKQTWQPEPGEGVAGDALVRTITIGADNMAGMFLPAVQIEKIDGISIYTESPAINDYTERGRAYGERTEKITYLFERAGTYIIPPVTYSWFNINAKRIDNLTLKGARVTIEPNPNYSEESPHPNTKQRHLRIKFWLPLIAAAGIVIILFIRFRHPLMTSFYEWQRLRKESEEAFFNTFRKACKSGDPLQIYNSFSLWLFHCQDHRAVTIGQFCKLAEDEELDRLASRLDAILFHKNSSLSSSSLDANHLFRLVARQRKKRAKKMAKEPGLYPCREG